MHSQRLSASLLAIFLASAPALAEPATSEGAKALGESFATYFGQSALDRGLIAVTPQGEDYKVAFDLQRVVDGFAPPAEFALRIGTLSFLTAPMPGGTWKVKADSFPEISWHFSTPKGDGSGTV